MISRRTFVLTGTAAAGMLPLATPALGQRRVDIRISHVHNSTHLAHTGVEAVAARITERTNGRLNFTVFPGAQIGSMAESVEQASQGMPVIAYTDPAPLVPFGVPELSVLAGPFLVSNLDEAFRLHDSALLEEWFKRLADTGGLRRLALNWLDGPRHIIGAVAYPLASDLQGVAIRVPPVEAWRRTFESLRAIPTTVEFAEVYSALSQGVVAAAECSLTCVQSARWYEVAKEITLTGHFQPFNGWVMSEAVFAELSAEEQAILLEEFSAGGVAHSRADEAQVANMVTELRGQGVNFTEADIESYRQGTASYYQGVAGWPEGLIDRVREAIAS